MASAQQKVILYDVRNFETYYTTLEGKYMQSPDASEVMLGIYADPIQQLKEENRSEYDKISATIAKMICQREQLVKSVWAEYLQKRSVTTYIVPENCEAKDKITVDCRYITNSLQWFV